MARDAAPSGSSLFVIPTPARASISCSTRPRSFNAQPRSPRSCGRKSIYMMAMVVPEPNSLSFYGDQERFIKPLTGDGLVRLTRSMGVPATTTASAAAETSPPHHVAAVGGVSSSYVFDLTRPHRVFMRRRRCASSPSSFDVSSLAAAELG
ncbi:hypothetical protein CLAIMM_00004 [Cladophialophora immunda]|nr:hypothetical protein CLAIMM_00004 [Cladophialophora immunda]